MGTHEDLTAGGGNIALAMQIEGFPALITNDSTNTSFSPWQDNTSFVDKGIFPGLELIDPIEQEIDPWNPKVRSSTIRVRVGGQIDGYGGEYENPTLSLAELVFRTESSSGARTRMTASLTESGTTLTVEDNSDFAAAPGDLWVGTEMMRYSAKPTSTTFTISSRGRYAPFHSDTVARWGRPHELTVMSGAVVHAPEVTSYKKTWVGCHVALWAHSWHIADPSSTTRTYNTKGGDGGHEQAGDAVLLFGGVITAIDEDRDGAVVFTIADMRESIKTALVPPSQYEATQVEGVWLTTDEYFIAREWTETDTPHTAGPWTVADADGAGTYSYQKLIAALNQWLQDEVTATNIDAVWGVQAQSTENGLRVRFDIQHTTASAEDVTSQIEMSYGVATLLGWSVGTGDAFVRRTFTTINEDDPGHVFWAPEAPRRASLLAGDTLELENETGTWRDQKSTLPAIAKEQVNRVASGGNDEWGFLISNGVVMLAEATNTAGQYTNLWYPAALQEFFGLEAREGELTVGVVSADEPAPRVRQIFAFGDTFTNVMMRLLYSVRGNAYNHATYDVYPFGAGIPHDALNGNQSLIDSLRRLGPLGAMELTVFITESEALADIIESDMAARQAHFVWRYGGIVVKALGFGSGANADHALTASNTATDVSTDDADQTIWGLTSEHLVSRLRVEHSRDFRDKTYKETVTLENMGAQTDLGRGDPLTWRLRNHWGTSGDSSADANALVASAGASILADWSHPHINALRTYACTLYHMAPGDRVTITDDYIRDPTTGKRGVTAAPAVVLRAAIGNFQSDIRTNEATLLLKPQALVNQATYSPAFGIDTTYSTAPFTNGYDGSADTTVTLVGTAVEVVSASSGTADIDISGISVADGDIIVLFCSSAWGSSGDGEISDVTDDGADAYTQRYDGLEIRGTGYNYFDCWTSEADGTETTCTVTIAASVASLIHIAVAVYRGVDTITTITGNSIDGTDTHASSSFTDDDGTAVLSWYVNRDGASAIGITTAPSDMTERADTTDDGDSVPDRELYIYDMAMSSRGSITRTMVWDQSDIAGHCAGVELRPATGTGPRIRLKANAFTDALEADDITHFDASDKIVLVEEGDVSGSPYWTGTASAIDEANWIITLSAVLTSYAGATKAYWGFSDDYSTAQTSQQSHVYLGDRVDGQVVNTRRAYEFSSEYPGPEDTAYSDAKALLPLDTWTDAEGEPLTPFHHITALENAQGLIDRKTQPHAQILAGDGNTTITPTASTTDTHIWTIPFYVPGMPGGGLKRRLRVAPAIGIAHMDHTVTCTIYSSPHPPTGAAWLGPTIAGGSSSVTFTHTGDANITKQAFQSLEIAMASAPSLPVTFIVVVIRTSNASFAASIRSVWAYLDEPEAI